MATANTKLTNLTTINLRWAEIYAGKIHDDLELISLALRTADKATSNRLSANSEAIRDQMKYAAHQLQELRRLLEI